MALIPTLAGDASMGNVFKNFPGPAPALLDLHEALMEGPSPLSRGQRELIAALVSILNNCTYCTLAHTSAAAAHGIEESVIRALAEGIESSGVDDKMVPILRYVKKLTAQPDSITQADADAIYAAGWNEQALHDTVVVCGLFNYMTRFVEGLGIHADPEYLKGWGPYLKKHGYAFLKKALPRN